MGEGFGLLTDGTARTIFLDPSSHSWPPIPLRSIRYRCLLSWVSGYRRIVGVMENVSLEVIVGRNYPLILFTVDFLVVNRELEPLLSLLHPLLVLVLTVLYQILKRVVSQNSCEQTFW